MYCDGYFFFFKQKTAYEMRISDWSSDVCSSDLPGLDPDGEEMDRTGPAAASACRAGGSRGPDRRPCARVRAHAAGGGLTPCPRTSGASSRDRKSVVLGKSVSVRVDLGGGRLIKKKKSKQIHNKRR